MCQIWLFSELKIRSRIKNWIQFLLQDQSSAKMDKIEIEDEIRFLLNFAFLFVSGSLPGIWWQPFHDTNWIVKKLPNVKSDFWFHYCLLFLRFLFNCHLKKVKFVKASNQLSYYCETVFIFISIIIKLAFTYFLRLNENFC